MDSIRIEGGYQLSGEINISGAKNSALCLMAASLLTDEPLTLSNVPHLLDVKTMASLLIHHGTSINMDGMAEAGHIGRVLSLQTKNISSTTAPYDLVRKMRASILVLGPILAREKEAHISLPGGCAIGTRPINLHLSGLEQLGAKIDLDEGYIHAYAPNGLKGASIFLPLISVGATENLLMAATLAKGQTILNNVAREPEISDLAHCLVSMGAKIQGIGTDKLTIEGVDRLHGAHHVILPDRIETGTFAIAALMTNGSLTLKHTRYDFLESLLKLLEKAGAHIDYHTDSFTIKRKADHITPIDAMTEPYPGFPTDLQAQFMTLMCIAQGACMISETIYENRFMHIPELNRLGANIQVHHSSAIVRGVTQLKGAPVMATDLRASVSLILAGLVAKGSTIVNRVYHLDRGYERLEEKLAKCGAHIQRIRTS